MPRPSIYEFAGGDQAFRALAAAHHERCLQDPVLNDPFRPLHPARQSGYRQNSRDHKM